jgi:polyphosphate kinase 1
MAKAAECLERCIATPYINREYSWLQFNRRVLDQAMDNSNPLLEKCKFLAITASNLDEFMQVRFGSLQNQNKETPELTENKTGLTAKEQMKAICFILPRFYSAMESTYSSLKNELYAAGLSIHDATDLTEAQIKSAHEFFNAFLLPQLSPLVLDAKHPMIKFTSGRTYLALRLEKNGHKMFGVLPVPLTRDRLVELPKGKKRHVIPVEDLIYLFGAELFSSFDISEKALIRVTRNADFTASVEDADIDYGYDFSRLVEDRVESRIHLEPVRLEVKAENETKELKQFLLKHLSLKKSRVFRVHGCFDYEFLYSLSQYFPYSELQALRFPAFKGSTPREIALAPSLIDYALAKDIFLSYPYNSMSTLTRLLEECATDKRVTTIKITIYRLAAHSEIIAALKKAAENGKEVTAVMELCARFDEEQNLSYAKVLREAGCTVFYGLENYKVHSKIVSIVLSENDKIRYITHLGTGNYNEKTACLYTDLNIITADNEIGCDAVAFFRDLAVMDLKDSFKSLLVAPVSLKKGLEAEIHRQMAKKSKGRIICKINSLTDLEIINMLIEASKAGVKIDLIVRGICCLIPGIEGVSENIRIISIVGRFLEHSRIYCFGEYETIYISSADFMTRNTDKRVEIATPVKDPATRKKIEHILTTMLSDNVKARELGPYGDYTLVRRKDKAERLNAQETFLSEARQ